MCVCIDWRLNPGPHAHQASTIPLDPVPRPFLNFWYREISGLRLGMLLPLPTYTAGIIGLNHYTHLYWPFKFTFICHLHSTFQPFHWTFVNYCVFSFTICTSFLLTVFFFLCWEWLSFHSFWDCICYIKHGYNCCSSIHYNSNIWPN